MAYAKRAIPTLNRCGWQLAIPSPLVEDWTGSYDDKHPLLDVGCAYGINTFEALERSIPTIAFDMEEGHLENIRKNVTTKQSPLLTCIFGSLPSNIQISDNSISGILVAEVFHFLIGDDVELSLATLHRKLVVGGKLVITAISDKMLAHAVSEDRQALFYQNLSKGEKWPGLIKVEDVLTEDDNKARLEKHLPEYVQVFSKRQLSDALERSGFDVKTATYGSHTGYPAKDILGRVAGLHLFLVAEKRLSKDVKK